MARARSLTWMKGRRCLGPSTGITPSAKARARKKVGDQIEAWASRVAEYRRESKDGDEESVRKIPEQLFFAVDLGLGIE